jgi:hypothetical protein
MVLLSLVAFRFPATMAEAQLFDPPKLVTPERFKKLTNHDHALPGQDSLCGSE